MLNSFPTLNGWTWAILIYIVLAIVTLIPTLKALFKKVDLNPGGASFNESKSFSEDNKIKLEHHYSRIHGTLIFWKNKAELFKYFHYYCIMWTMPISILIPTITQFIDGSTLAKSFLTMMSLHAALLLGLHKILKVENNYKSFRHGESEFYDLYREFLDMPYKFGKDEKEQIENYFMKVQQIRKNVRNMETDNFPSVSEFKNDEKKT
ncbi:MAG: hypothetical protein N3B21_08485 [Clostridia bacterium]|nr:hypothetical protein [Clostridia bacterium]